jgi:nucleoside-diphosphate-sugar epimerase
MRVLITGHDGYIGRVMAPVVAAAGHEVVGLDNYLYEGCDFGDPSTHIPVVRLDVRDVEARDLEGFDAIIHLAGISNDPVGDLNPECTYSINHRASVRLAETAKKAGVPRFLFASSCSLYGAADAEVMLTETAEFSPVTAYGTSKVLVEQDVSQLAGDDFSPTFMRNATVYGASPRLRADLVVNNLVGFAYLTGEVLIMSDGTPWRPLVHVEDVTEAFLAVLTAPREIVHNQAFNVGRNEENYQIRDVANIVADVVPGSKVVYAPGGGPDLRCYRVDFSKLDTTFPELKLRWNVRRGAEQLLRAYEEYGLRLEDFTGARYMRVRHIKEAMEKGEIDPLLRRVKASSVW